MKDGVCGFVTVKVGRLAVMEEAWRGQRIHAADHRPAVTSTMVDVLGYLYGLLPRR